jgi:RND superfamily putative drug exporter
VLGFLLLLSIGAVRPLIETSMFGADDEAVRAAQILRTDFVSGYDYSTILVVSGLGGSKLPLAEVLDRVVTDVAADPAVVRTISYRNTQDTLFLGRNGRGFLVLVGFADNLAPGAKEAILGRLRAKTDGLSKELAYAAPLLAMRWTGEIPLDIDLWNVAAAEARQAELRILPLVLVVLVVAFGSIVAAAVPICIGLGSVLLALGAAAVIGRWMPLAGVYTNVVTMMGLGLGVDYALLIVNRFREELAGPQSGRSAAARTGASAGRTIILSGSTVATGFLILLIVPNKDMRSIAIGGVIVITIASMLAAKALPLFLARLGPAINALGLRRSTQRSRLAMLFRSWSTIVFAHPLRVFLLGILPISFLALQSVRLDVRLPRGDWLPSSAESVQATDDLKAFGRAGMFQAVEVVITLPAGEHLYDEAGWVKVAELSERLQADPRIASIRSIVTAGAGQSPWKSLQALPSDLLNSFTSRDRAKALLVVIPRSGQEIADINRLVRDVRGQYGSGIAKSGGSVAVGGLIAQSVDDDNVVRHRFPIVLLTMLIVTFVILASSLGSVFLALKATLLNALSVGAAFGALVLVFQDGYGSGLMGLAAPTAGIFPNIPILTMCIVFGLSMDYEVFLFSRVRESHRCGLADAECMAIALEKTAGVLTSAALVMMIVFMGFCFGQFLLIKMLGFTLSMAVFLDVTLIRLVLGPALFAWAGRWNWWPGG